LFDLTANHIGISDLDHSHHMMLTSKTGLQANVTHANDASECHLCGDCSYFNTGTLIQVCASLNHCKRKKA